jgi:gas vesicle protein
MKFTEDDSNLDGIIAALAVGIGLGFGLGILFAPRSGARTRSAIARGARDGIDQIRDRVEDIHSSASDLVEKGKRAMDEHKETVASVIDGAKKTLRNVTG